MINELVNLLPSFPGQPNQTRCFLHIINLVAKSVIRQFDVTKGKADNSQKSNDALYVLAEGMDLEDLETQREKESSNGDADDNIDGWVDERNILSTANREALDVSVRPVKVVLIKVNSWLFGTSVVAHLISTAAQNCILNYTLHNTSAACVVPDT